MTRCSGREHPSGLTFAPSTKGRTRSVPNRYCGSRTSISPNFVCQRSFFHPGDASEGVDESPAPSPPLGSRPNCAAPPVPEDASLPPSALPQRRLPSIPPRRLRPPARSMRPASEAQDAPAKPPSAHHRSTPSPPSASSRQIKATEHTPHRFESHPCHRYLSARANQLNYRQALAEGLPIGSGEIESAHRYVAQQRLKRPG